MAHTKQCPQFYRLTCDEPRNLLDIVELGERAAWDLHAENVEVLDGTMLADYWLLGV